MVPVTDPIYTNFELDQTYEWAKPIILHAKKLLLTMSTINKDVYASGDIFNLEIACGDKFHRWFGNNFTLMFSTPIKTLVVNYSLLNDKSSIKVHDIQFNNLPSSGYIECHFGNGMEQIDFLSPTFCPAKLYNSADCRELGIFIHSIKYIDMDGNEFFSTIDELIVLDEVSKFLCGYKTAKNNIYYHSGDLGDIIYSLPVIKHTGGGTLYLGPELKIKDERFHPREAITYEKFQFLKPLLESQDYIKNVVYTESYPTGITHDLNRFRTFYFKTHNEYGSWPNGTNINLIDANLSINELDPSIRYTKWLFVKNKSLSNKRIIFNRTDRYQSQNDDIDNAYKYIVGKFGNFCGFIGLESEYESFVKNYGQVEHLKVTDANELAQIIDQCYVFIGNTSFACSISESLKKDVYLESPSSGVKHAIIKRDGVESFNIITSKDIQIGRAHV